MQGCYRYDRGRHTGHDPGAEDVFDSLGIDTDLGDRLDSKGNALPDDYNPLSTKVTSLFKYCEIFAADMGANYSDGYVLFDLVEFKTSLGDSGGSLRTLATGDDTRSKQQAPRGCVAADVDGDGLDEVVIATAAMNGSDEVHIDLYDYDETSKIDLGTESDCTISVPGLADLFTTELQYYMTKLDMAAGDVDGDGRDEILLSVVDSLFILEDDLSGELESWTFTTKTGVRKNTTICMDTADFDFDGYEEIVLAVGVIGNVNAYGEYYIFDDSSTGFDALVSGADISTWGAGSMQVGLCTADVACGDFDGDGLQETAFSGVRYENAHIMDTMVLDTYLDDSSEVQFAFIETDYSVDFTEGWWLSGVAAGDIDGDGIDEIAVLEDIYNLDITDEENHRGSFSFPFGEDAQTWDDDDVDSMVHDLIEMGDVNGDGYEDVVYVTKDWDQMIIGYWDGFAWQHDVWSLIVNKPGSDQCIPAFCLPNVDNDSAVVEYLGHDLYFTDPIVVAVIASPPYWTGINEDGEGGTSYGEVAGTSTTNALSLGFKVGGSVGFDVKAPFGLAEAQIKTTCEHNFNWDLTWENETTEEWGYATGVGEDKVVFTSLPLDVYTYRILSSSDESEIGDIITISNPRSPGEYHQERNYYNAHNGEGYDIGSSVLVHSTGNPFTYADEDDRDDLIADHDSDGLFTKSFRNVGISSTGFSFISLEQLSSFDINFDYEYSVEVEAEASGGGGLIGISGGAHIGYCYAVSTPAGVGISGEVPDIPPESSRSSLLFSWGLMAYPVEDGDQEFTVVTYWVDAPKDED